MDRRSLARRVTATTAALIASLAIASTAFAHECVNFSKSDQGAGAQIIFGPGGEILEITPGALARIQRGLIDPGTGEGFHGLAGLDIDGDGVVDVSTWFGVGPDGEIPLQAQLRGPACKGVINVDVYFTQCAGG
jgi:hypothetical protein